MISSAILAVPLDFAVVPWYCGRFGITAGNFIDSFADKFEPIRFLTVVDLLIDPDSCLNVDWCLISDCGSEI